MLARQRRWLFILDDMADFSKGWITLLRSIQDNFLWKFTPFDKGRAWIDLILTANHKENKVLIGNQIIMVKRGEFITSQRKLSEKWGWSRNTVRTFLAILQREQMIELKSTNNLTHINIINYNNLQKTSTNKKAAKEPPLEPRQSHDLSTNKEVNNDNNVNKERFTPPTLDELKDYCLKNNFLIDCQRFIDFYQSKGWMIGKNKMKDWQAAVRNWEKGSEKPMKNKPRSDERDFTR